MKRTPSPKLPPPGCCIVLDDIDWKTYTRLLQVFADRRSVRLTYDRGRLEIMSRPLARAYRHVPPPEHHGKSVLLQDIEWDTYTHLLRVFAQHPRVRLTYDRGDLEIMSPTLAHDDDSDILGSFVFVLTLELGLPIKRGGSTTLRRRLRRRGIESDRCFWIANAHRMAGRRRLNLRVDPPPDLGIEVDVTCSSLDRLSVYAALRVPEVWRLQEDVLTFYVLQADGSYATTSHSLAFPLVTPAGLLGFLQQARQSGDENVAMQQFIAWIRQRKAGSSLSSAS